MDAMSEAIDHAVVMLLGVSLRYKESASELAAQQQRGASATGQGTTSSVKPAGVLLCFSSSTLTGIQHTNRGRGGGVAALLSAGLTLAY